MKPTLLLRAFVIFFITISVSEYAGAQDRGIFKRKTESKKELIRQRDSLKLLVRSLTEELEVTQYNLEIADSLNMEEEINPGYFEIEDSDNTVVRHSDPDSLLSQWYIRNSQSMNTNFSELDSMEFTSNIPDSVYIERLAKLNCFINIPYNSIVKNHIIFYTQRMPNSVDVIIGLSDFYMPQFEEIFDSYDLPKELKAIAVIESALNPKAVSRKSAKGMWQFMYNTARQYGLIMNSYVDERFDPIKSADAAARYMKDAYNIFGDWALAIASYNCGAGNVNKAIRRSGSREIWDIYPFLPRETRGYIPSFIAALYTLEYYKEHRIVPTYTALPPHVDTIHVNKMLHFDQISENIGIKKEELRALNPQYLHDIIPGVEREYILRIPYNYTTAFVENENEIYKYKDSIFFNPTVLKKIKETGSATANSITYTVKNGDTMGGIALKYRVKLSDLQRWNGVKSNIRIGQKLIIYTSGSGPAATSSSTTSGKGSSSSDSTPKASTTVKDGYIVYTVKSGDNFYNIAKAYPGISAQNIMDLNGLTNDKIKPGIVIKIKKAN